MDLLDNQVHEGMGDRCSPGAPSWISEFYQGLDIAFHPIGLAMHVCPVHGVATPDLMVMLTQHDGLVC